MGFQGFVISASKGHDQELLRESLGLSRKSRGIGKAKRRGTQTKSTNGQMSKKDQERKLFFTCFSESPVSFSELCWDVHPGHLKWLVTIIYSRYSCKACRSYPELLGLAEDDGLFSHCKIHYAWSCLSNKFLLRNFKDSETCLGLCFLLWGSATPNLPYFTCWVCSLQF